MSDEIGKVYPPSTKILIADDSMAATISCVAIYAHGGVLYEVVWWKDGTRNSAWMSENEFTTVRSKDKTTFGFK